MSVRLVCAGDVGVDLYVNDNARYSGGCTLNVAENLAVLAKEANDKRLSQVSVVSAVGTEFDSYELHDMVRLSWPKSQLIQIPGCAPIQRIELSPEGERKFCGYDSGVLSGWQLTPIQKQVVSEADLLMMPLYTQFERCFREICSLARGAGLVVDFMDFTDYPVGHELVLETSKILRFGFFGLSARDGARISNVRELSRKGDGIFVVTLGSEGSLVFASGVEKVRVPAVPLAGKINTTGAGDAFAAAFLFSFIKYGSEEYALSQASEHAARVVSGSLQIAKFFGKN